ncbi:MAG TPA: MFS transporter [Methanocorpusculum sp.]|nr:MFS transporter [Methanocorpusculum sp.]
MSEVESSPDVKEKITLKTGLLIAAVTLFFGVVVGFRGDFSEIIGIIADSGDTFSYTDLQLANTVCRFVTALASPLIAFLTLKKSNFFVLTFGVITTILGLFCIAVATSFPVMFIGLGILFAVGSAALSFGIIFGLVSLFVGEKTAIAVSTLFSLATTFFTIAYAPAIQLLSDTFGYKGMLFILILIVICAYPLTFTLSGKKKEVVVKKQKDEIQFKEALSLILKNKITYVMIAFFFVMGLSSGVNNHSYTAMLSVDLPSLGVSITFSFMKLIAAIGLAVMTLLVLRVKRPVHLAALIFLLFGVLIGAQLFVPPEDMYGIVFVYIALFIMGAFYPIATLLVRRNYAPILIATLFTILTVFEKLGSGLNSILGGFIYDTTGGFVPLIILESAMTILFAGVLLILLLVNFAWSKKGGGKKDSES